MPSLRPFCRSALAIVLLAVSFGRARAADAPPDARAASTTIAQEIGLEYDAPRDCPDVGAYLADVEQRIGPNWKAALKELAVHVTATVVRTGERYAGTLEFVNVRGERFSRTVSGTVCTEIVRGIGLMTSLAVKARVGEPAIAADASTTTAAEPSRPASTPESPSQTRTAPGEESGNRATAGPSTRSKTDLHVRFGARASLTSGVGPGTALGPGAFAVLELAQVRLGLGADIVSAGDVQARTIRADFRLLSARLEACPWSFELERWGTLEPCATGELGSFRAAPELDPPVVTVSEPKSITWGAVGLLGRLVVHVRPFLAQFEVIGRAPLRRERFFVGSQDDVVFQIPAVSAGASVGVGVEF